MDVLPSLRVTLVRRAAGGLDPVVHGPVEGNETEPVVVENVTAEVLSIAPGSSTIDGALAMALVGAHGEYTRGL